MPKLYSSKQIVKILLERGFLFISQRGSHQKYRKIGNPTLTVIIPADRKEIPFGTFRSILRQSGLTEEDFKKNH
ncbi:MAG: type II toxin-antitoxin system HicA family toxin [Candidatus Berkelbacteria bacterium]|nr:type II toxin-antitoxin system HicA family toxin [Candidatus Berkelbacteria bacterium]